MKRPSIVYILASQRRGTIYIGVSTHIHQRLEQHRTGTFEGFTKTYAVKRLVYFEVCDNVIDGRRREQQLKAWRRQWKIELIEKQNPDWNDLSRELPLG